MQALDMAGHLIRRLHQHSTQVYTARTREAGFDITSVQFAALDAIKANPGIDQAGVAALIAYDRPTIGEVINRLVAKGLVEREESAHDRRAHSLSLTAAGRKKVPVLAALADENDAGFFSVLTMREHQALGRILKALAERRGLKTTPVD